MKKPTDIGRRHATRLLVASTAVLPLAALVRHGVAFAQDRLDPEDPTAKALKYTHDASQAERADKLGVAGSEQFCENCQFIQAGGDGEWLPCMIFGGRLVAAKGWCASWAPKA
jgi:hypothetical protein